jgi:hypothetical protein
MEESAVVVIGGLGGLAVTYVLSRVFANLRFQAREFLPMVDRVAVH